MLKTIKYTITFLLFILFVENSYCLISKITLYEEIDYSGNGAIITTRAENFTFPCTMSGARSRCRIGMWQIVYVNAANITSVAIYSTQTETCATIPLQLGFRPLASANTTVQAISLYEDRLITIPMSTEHYFYQPAWSGNATTFPIRALALTGWSNWTLYEDAFFGGRSWCLRSTAEFQYLDNLDNSTYPTRVGSLLRGCNVRADKVLYVPLIEPKEFDDGEV